MPKIVNEPIILLAYGESVIGWSNGKLMGDKEWQADAEFASQAKMPQYLYHDGPFVCANLDGTLLEVFSALYYFAGDRTRILEAPESLLEQIVIGYSENMESDDDNEYYTHERSTYLLDGQRYLVA